MMKKMFFFLLGLVGFLFLESCQKEQLKPSTGSPIQNADRNHIGLNGNIVPAPPPVIPPGKTGFLQKEITSHTALNGTIATKPPPLPPPGKANNSKDRVIDHTGLNGNITPKPPPVKPPEHLTIVQK
jgi:hypothetical protein